MQDVLRLDSHDTHAAAKHYTAGRTMTCLTSANVARASFVAAPRLPKRIRPSSCTLGMASDADAMLPLDPSCKMTRACHMTKLLSCALPVTQ